MKQEKLYEILNTIRTSNTLTEVANKLYISQPYISEVIHNAETKYKTTIVKRKPLPIELTDAGQIILAAMGQMIEVENKLEHDIAPYSQQKDTAIKIAFHQPWTITYGADFMKKLQQSFPTINFDISELTTDIGERKLLNGEIDIFIGREFSQPELETHLIMNEPIVMLVPSTSKLYRQNFKTHFITKEELANFENENFVNLTDDSYYQRTINHSFNDIGIHPSIAIKFSSIIAAARAATNGMGCNITIFNLIKDFINVRKCNVYKIPSWFFELNLGLSYRRDSTKIIKDISNKLTQLLRQYA